MANKEVLDEEIDPGINPGQNPAHDNLKLLMPRAGIETMRMITKETLALGLTSFSERSDVLAPRLSRCKVGSRGRPGSRR